MQNEQTLQQMIREYEANMPPEIMALIKTFDWKREMRTVVNQNQLMIDVGADIEESVYLMILGVIQVGDLYERLVETHEMPEDKARKVIEEIENLIFNPLHQKLMELEKTETKDKPVAQPVTAPVSIPAKDPTRDDILAEIENDSGPIVIKKPTMPSAGGAVVVEDQGIRKPFSLSMSSDVVVEKPEIEAPVAPVIPAAPDVQTAPTSPTPITGVQKDSVSVGLTQPTVTQAAPAPVQAPKPYAADPYREPIE